jgi:agmatine deiminase
MGWPGRDQVPTRLIAEAREAHGAIAARLAEYEPVLMVVHPGFGQQAAAACGPKVDILEVPLGTAWMRDAAPLFSIRNGEVVAVDFRFNSWGETLPPYVGSIGERLCRRLGIHREPVPLVLEGGSVAVDGHGTLIAVESTILNANRNPDATRGQFEEAFQRYLGVERTVWLPQGLPDDETGGHADNVVAFVGPGRVLSQLPEHRSQLDEAGLEVVPFDLPTSPVRYLNFYVGNGCVLVPVAGQPADRRALGLLGEHFPDREVIGVDGLALALGGGGVHCITQQIPQV